MVSPKRVIIIHPILLAIYPPLFLFARNYTRIPFRHILTASLFLVLIAVVLWGTLTLIFRNKIKAGLIVSLVFTWVFFYQVVFEIGRGLMIGDITIWRHKYVFASWCIINLVGAMAIILRRSSLSYVSRVVNLFSIVLIIFSLSLIAIQGFKGNNPERPIRFTNRAPLRFENRLQTNQTSASLPDIYFIVFDAYSSETALRKYFNFDNSPLYEYLRKKGFYVASQSHSNYGLTRYSLASSLNLDYLQNITNDLPSIGRLRLYSNLMKKNSLSLLLKEIGYRYVNIGFINEYSDMNIAYKETESNYVADDLPSGQSKQLIMKYLVSMTFLNYFTQFADIIGSGSYRKKILYELEQLRGTKNMEGPKFVFAHILAPHFPFAFGPDGETIPVLDSFRVGLRQLYVRQLSFINKKIEELLDVLITSPETSPIIILQSDHGQKVDTPGDSVFDRQALEESFGILNACYLPDKNYEGFYDTMTPVNTIRIVLNKTFSAGLQLLKDEIFIHTREGFINISAYLQSR